MKSPLVGIMGISGAAGKNAYRILKRYFRIRGGGRHGPKENFGDAEWIRADVQEPETISRFVKGCDVVLNCAGPSYYIGDAIWKIAEKEGVIYVDAFGADLLMGGREKDRGTLCVAGAGSFPGLSGLIVKFMAEKYPDRKGNVTVYYGVNEGMTRTAAVDFLLSVIHGFSMPGAVIRQGEVMNLPDSDQGTWNCPLINQNVFVQTCLNAETAAQSRLLNLENVCWYNIMPTLEGKTRLTAIFKNLLKDFTAQNLEIQAGHLEELYGKEASHGGPWNIQVTETGGNRHVFRAETGTEITGMMAALAVKSAINSKRKGICWAWEIMEYEEVMKELLTEGTNVCCGISRMEEALFLEGIL
ncbi:hypothetical protein AALB39_01525 [Lachnospiraceae bacterium 54-53]